MSARILRFRPRPTTCALCHGTLVPEKSWHRYHRDCLAWVYRLRAVPFLAAASELRRDAKR